MDLVTHIRKAVQGVLAEKYQFTAATKDILVNETKTEFTGDYTVVLFSFAKSVKTSPDAVGNILGEALLQSRPDLFSSFNVIKGFLNLIIRDGWLISFLSANYGDEGFGKKAVNDKRVMVEYSSPNTNKPLHLGHLRNNFLGWSVASIYQANGYQVIKTCIANDRGIHICKSMLAWQLYAHGATPESTGIKGDHFVGDYYVLFGAELQKQVDELTAAGITKEVAEREAPLMKAAQQMLIDWESGKPDIIDLWKTMNQWVYDGFDITYRRIGSDFDRIYYESETYLLGKDLVMYGLEKNIFYKNDDGSVWIDLAGEGLDQKIVQRKDGTAVYITQDIGLAEKKYEEYKAGLSLYVVADEQNYHFKVLRLICEKLGLPSAAGLFHLSYGLVDLPSGRMKTREGTVVDADDMLDEMIREAEKKTLEQGKTEGFSPEELADLYEMIGVGGLKFFLLRVDPKKRLLFNPEESIELHGFTATFIQYAHSRIRSILRKEQPAAAEHPAEKTGDLFPAEKTLILELEKYPSILDQACLEMSPSVVAGYVFNVAKAFNSFYNLHSITNAETADKKTVRLQATQLTGIVMRSSMALLGIRVPERM